MSVASPPARGKYGGFAALVGIVGGLVLTIVSHVLISVSQSNHPVSPVTLVLARVANVAFGGGIVRVCVRRLRARRLGRFARWAVGIVGCLLLLPAFLQLLLEPLSAIQSLPLSVVGGALLYLALERP